MRLFDAMMYFIAVVFCMCAAVIAVAFTIKLVGGI